MKALYVFYRIFHYFALWLFILAGLVVAYGLWAVGGEALGFYGLVLGGLAIFFWALAHIFKQAHKNLAKKRARECRCCKCEEAPASDLDEQVEEIMKWKNLYVEGIITEREFIDKRNEILRLSK